MCDWEILHYIRVYTRIVRDIIGLSCNTKSESFCKVLNDIIKMLQIHNQQHLDEQLLTLKYYMNRAFAATIADLNACIELHSYFADAAFEHGREFYILQEKILKEIKNDIKFYLETY